MTPTDLLWLAYYLALCFAGIVGYVWFVVYGIPRMQAYAQREIARCVRQLHHLGDHVRCGDDCPQQGQPALRYRITPRRIPKWLRARISSYRRSR